MNSSLYGAGAEYALHSLLTLATRPEPVSVRDLATYQQIPERFLAKIFTRLKKARIVEGIEGIAGGFALARPAGEIRVMDVLAAVEKAGDGKVRVYRAENGTARVEYWIVGLDKEGGKIVGLKAKAVES